MRKLKLQMQVSVDGYVATADNNMDWIVWNWDDALNKYVTELTGSIDCILLGRKLAEGFVPAWQSYRENPDMKAAADIMLDTPKIVFTKTLEKSPWENTRLAKGDLVKEIKQLKAQEGKDIIVYGGGTLVSNLIKAGLIDELHLFVNPAALGEGMKIFTQRTSLSLQKSMVFDCGINVLVYVPAPKA